MNIEGLYVCFDILHLWTTVCELKMKQKESRICPLNFSACLLCRLLSALAEYLADYEVTLGQCDVHTNRSVVKFLYLENVCLLA